MNRAKHTPTSRAAERAAMDAATAAWLALAMNPAANPNRVLKQAAHHQQKQGRFNGTTAAQHVAGVLFHHNPIGVLMPAIQLHQQQTGI